MLYVLLSCVLTLSQMFPTIFKPREIHNFNQGNGQFNLVTCGVIPPLPKIMRAQDDDHLVRMCRRSTKEYMHAR